MKAISTPHLRISFLWTLLFFSSSVFAFDIFCPPDVTINCGSDTYDLSQYGNAQYHDYTGYHNAGYPVVTYNLNNCGTGTIIRTWSATNPYDNVVFSCSQYIYVGGSTFNESNITWPLEYLDISGCNPNLSPNALPPGYQKPTWSSGTCALIGSSYSDKTFYFSGACKKVVRTWEVINCCIHNPYTGYGSYKFTQEFNVTISDVPQVACASDITVDSYNCSGAYVDVPGIVIPTTECSEFVTIMNDSPYSTSGENASGNYPLGTTVVTFTADFGCWQKTMCQIKVTVNDATTPTPYCIYGLSIALMGVDADQDGQNESGMVDIWASDLDKGSFPSCNSNSDLIFSFSSDVNDKSRTFTCDDVGRNDVQVWVTDKNGKQNYCNTYVRIQNNAANILDCEDSDDFSTISGHVESHHGERIKNIQLKAVSTSHEGEEIFVEETVTVETVIDSFLSASGNMIYILDIETVVVLVPEMVYTTKNFYTNQDYDTYSFDDMSHYNDFKIYGILEDPNFELIDLADIDLIEDYINGLAEFTAYQKLAADVNIDGQIDEEDLILLRNIIAGNAPDDFETKWHFMDKGLNIDNMPAGHECEEFCRIMDLKEDIYKVNLIGYRLGDVTNVRMSTGKNDRIFADQVHNSDVQSQLSLRESNNIIDNQLTVGPNPFVNSIKVNLISKSDLKTSFILRNELGQIVLDYDLKVFNGSNQYHVTMPVSMTSGLYYWEVKIGQEQKTGKIIKM